MKYEIQLYKKFELIKTVKCSSLVGVQVEIEQNLFTALHRGEVTQVYIERFEEEPEKEIDTYA